jgi:hypothetical protein
MNIEIFKYADPLVTKLKEFMGTLVTLVNYITTDIEKRPRSFKIGVFSIFLVVTFLVVLQSALELTPLVFLKMAQDKTGQYDFTILPISAENDTRLSSDSQDSNSNTSTPMFRGLNLTEIELKLERMTEIAGLAPRWLLPVEISNPDTPDTIFNVLGLILDSKREREIGIGSNSELEDLGQNDCWITESVGRLLNLNGNILSS